MLVPLPAFHFAVGIEFFGSNALEPFKPKLIIFTMPTKTDERKMPLSRCISQEVLSGLHYHS